VGLEASAKIEAGENRMADVIKSTLGLVERFTKKK